MSLETVYSNLYSGGQVGQGTDSGKSPTPSQSVPGARLYTSLHDPALVAEKLDEFAVGFGGFSDVWRARMTGKVVTELVALKVLRPMGPSFDRVRKCLEREVRCWRPLHHKNIAPFYGVFQQPNGSRAIVSPWYKNGSANVYVKQDHDRPETLTLTILEEIAAGIEYLHVNGVIHGDLKGVNVMIDDKGHARIIDFGLSRLIDSDPGLTTPTASTTRWCAPELLTADDARITKASDVYAFASTALELLSGDVPYSKLSSKNAVRRNVLERVNPRSQSNDFRFSIPRSDLLWQFLEDCWMDAALRPTISQVRQRLRSFTM